MDKIFINGAKKLMATGIIRLEENTEAGYEKMIRELACELEGIFEGNIKTKK